MPAGPWQGAAQWPDGWRHLAWFGWFHETGPSWIYHHELGWLRVHGATPASLHLHDPVTGTWFWTSASVFPLLYKLGTNAGWYQFDRAGRPGARWFFHFTDHAWVAERLLNAPPLAGFVRIPAGSFPMGSPADEPGRGRDETRHTVTLTRDFHLYRTEVTWAHWDGVRRWALNHGYAIPAPGDSAANPNHPVTNVAWHDVVKWLNAWSELEGLTPCYTVGGVVMRTGTAAPACDFDVDGFRLPTEAEWEYACRAGTTTAFYSGPMRVKPDSPGSLDPNLDPIAWYAVNSGGTTHPAGWKQPNAWGLHDMSGNVWELCWDWYGGYGGDAVDPAGPATGLDRVRRGGDCASLAEDCRSAVRLGIGPGFQNAHVGFRPARTIRR